MKIDACILEIYQLLKDLKERVLEDLKTSASFIQSLIVELEPKWSHPTVELTSSSDCDNQILQSIPIITLTSAVRKFRSTVLESETTSKSMRIQQKNRSII
jgi:hypothetical protein